LDSPWHVAPPPRKIETALARDLRPQDRREISQHDLSIEIERNAIHRHLLLCLALVVSEKGIVPELVVVQVNSRDIARVFPGGKRSNSTRRR